MKILNNQLLSAMVNKVGDFTEEDVKNIIAVAINSKFYIPTKVESEMKVEFTEGSDADYSDKKSVAFPCFSFEEGNMLPIFTDLDEYNKYIQAGNKGNPYIIEFGDLAKLIEDTERYDGFMLNMYGRHLPFTKNILSVIHDSLVVN